MKIIASLLMFALLVIGGCKQKKPEMPEGMANPHAGMDMKSPHAGMNSNDPHAGMDAPDPARMPGGLDLDAMTASLPEGWSKTEPSSSMRVMQLAIAPVKGDPAPAELVFFHFPGSGGSAAANIQRWQNQYTGAKGEPGTQFAKTDTMMVGVLTVVTTDVSGTQLASASMGVGTAEDKPNYRMIASVIETPSGNWFIKVTGPAKTMAANEANIRAFIKKAKVREGGMPAGHP